LPENILKGIIDCVKEHDPLTRITVEIDGYRFGTNQEIDSATLWQRHAATPEMVFSIDAAITRNPCKIALGGTDVVKLTETLAQRFAGSVSIVGSQLIRPLVNITSPASTKPGALQKLLLPHGIPLSMVLAFGDDIPDIDMLQECGISVAMSNAFPEVKAVCRYETTSNDDDGVAVVLEKMLRETSG
jgi:hydroxymethylpyrimidine pyrophosphatase-like HAD family hydrolase